MKVHVLSVPISVRGTYITAPLVRILYYNMRLQYITIFRYKHNPV